MKTIYALGISLTCILNLHAQQSVRQIIFLNEGWYDFVNNTSVIPPSVGSYNPQTQEYHVFDEIPEADFASDVLVDDVIYVAADNLLITYDKNTLTRLQMAEIPGIRSLAIWNDQLLVSRGDYLVFFDSYFQVYDKQNLALLYDLDTLQGPRYASEGIIVRNDTAYLAINNGFVFGEEVGKIGIIDLKNRTYAGEIDLGPDGINPDNIMLGTDRIHTLNNKNYTSSSISTINPHTREVSLFDKVAANAGCGTSALANDHIYYMEYGVDKLARFDVRNAEIVDTLEGTEAYYGLIDDKINERLVATWTDFFSSGIAYILDYQGNVMHSFNVGVSPGSIALDVRTATGIESPAWPESAVQVFPNPVSAQLHLTADDMITGVRLIDQLGRVASSVDPSSTSFTIAVHDLPAGMYSVQVALKQGGERAYRIVKR